MQSPKGSRVSEWRFEFCEGATLKHLEYTDLIIYIEMHAGARDERHALAALFLSRRIVFVVTAGMSYGELLARDEREENLARRDGLAANHYVRWLRERVLARSIAAGLVTSTST